MMSIMLELATLLCLNFIRCGAHTWSAAFSVSSNWNFPAKHSTGGSRNRRRLSNVARGLGLEAVGESGGLTRMASFSVRKPYSKGKDSFSLVISHGSVVDFSFPANPAKAAIVNAANEQCLGGGGVDGAISLAGGPNLAADRRDLPVLPGSGNVRCPTGQARLTGPNSYGDLHVAFVCHAVGPNYLSFRDRPAEGDRLLRSAYTDSLTRAKEEKLEAVAFSLLSSGIFRGDRTKREVLEIGMKAVTDFEGYDELKEVHMCAYSLGDVDELLASAETLGLTQIEE